MLFIWCFELFLLIYYYYIFINIFINISYYYMSWIEGNYIEKGWVKVPEFSAP